MSLISENKKFLRFPEVSEETGKSRAAIYVAMKNGSFPKSFRIGARSVAWSAESIQAWKEACIKASNV